MKENFKRNVINFFKVIVWYVLFLVFLASAMVFVPTFLNEKLEQSSMDGMLLYGIANLVLYLYAFGIPYLIIRLVKVYKPNLKLFKKDNKELNKNIIKNILWAVVAALTLQGLGMCISGLSTMIVGSNTLNDAFTGMATKYPAWLISAFIAIPPAIFEELIFRGALQEKSKQYFSPLTSSIITSILFGVMHLDWQQLPYAIVLGFAFALIYEKTKSIWTTILIHFIIDFSQFYLLIVELQAFGDEISNADTSLPWQAGIIFSVLGILLAFLNAKVIKKFKIQNEEIKTEETLIEE